MPDLKISAAPPNPAPAGTDSFATNKAGVDFQTTLSQILAAIIFPPPPPEVNDLSAAVTWANIPDANVPASAVTQHQAALAILRAQLTDLATVSQAEAEAGVATTDRIWTAERVAQAIAALGGGGGGFPEYLFYADQFENPNNADWNINALAPAAADSNNAALTVRLFDDAVAEGVGMQFKLPLTATSLTFETVSRAETTPAGAVVASPRIHLRTIGDNAAVPAPPNTQLSLTGIDLPTNENFQYDSQTITFAFLGLTAGDYVQFEYSRNATLPADTLVGDWALLSLRVSFT